MPKSWSKSKKLELALTPCSARPDKDNLEKGFLDCLYSSYGGQTEVEDAHVWDGRTIKLWAYQGCIEVFEIDCILESILSYSQRRCQE